MGVPYAEVIGDPVVHSKSPLIHRFWLEKLGLQGDYRRTRVTPDALPAFVAARREEPDWRGCNVTMPLKEAIVREVDETDELASVSKAANTVVARSGRLRGYNTDVLGFYRALMDEKGQELPANHVATLVHLIGAGGAARAVAVALRGMDLTIFNRTRSKADSLADELGLGASYGFSAGLNDLQQPEPAYDPRYPDVKPNRGENQRYSYVVVNASSLGMRGKPPLPIDLSFYPSNTIVFDLVYDPVETPLLREARQLGMTTIDGLTMLVAQAAEAFELFFGAKAPRENEGELRELLTR